LEGESEFLVQKEVQISFFGKIEFLVQKEVQRMNFILRLLRRGAEITLPKA
jgi:hypothetical protein